MRPKSSENGYPEKLEESQLSGACIRSLVKQLASSRTKDLPGEEGIPRQQNNPEILSDKQEIKHRKKVRRRAQTSKPYQERLINMAEARREIVTALKLHRATMKLQNQQRIQSGPDISSEKEAKLKSSRNPRIYDSNVWPLSSIEALDFALPSQTLGLNLNLRDFEKYYTINPSSICSSSSPSTSSSPPPAAAEVVEFSKDEKDRLKYSMEIMRPEDEKDEDLVESPFDEVMEFPAWMNANEGLLQHANGLFSEDPALPCMDIEEIEGMDDVDWLA